MEIQQVEHLIIGAGVAGLTLRHFLDSASVAIVDPAPGSYKIGESMIPELFRHPELAALIPRIQGLPSYTPKYGTTFVAQGEVAYFPIGEREVGEAMHVARDELEREMAAAWEIEVTRAAVTSIDWDRKRVETTAGTYAVSGLILDCSGPAMVVARSRGEIEELLPAYATWAYYDVVSEHPGRLQATLEERGWRYLKYDVRHRRAIPSAVLDGREILATTHLTMIADGVWAWQIPLFGGTRLSYGVVSRHGPVSPARYRELAEVHVAPHFEIARRGEEGPSAYDKLHTRSGIARRAQVAADRDYILLADAYGFSDPVYSVGAGLAVSQAIEVAQMLNDGGWTEARCKAYVARCRRTLDRAREGFEFWYRGVVLSDAAVGEEVQRDFLLGGMFQTKISEHYGAAIDLAVLDSERDPFEVAWEGADLLPEVQALLATHPGAPLVGWTLVGARPCAGGLQLRWTYTEVAAELPELTMLAALDEAEDKPCFRRSGAMALSYMQLFDQPYPEVPALGALFDAVVDRVRGDERALVDCGQAETGRS